jgi:hypothetical protein
MRLTSENLADLFTENHRPYGKQVSAMESLAKGLQASARRSLITQISKFSVIHPFWLSRPVQSRYISSGHSPQSRAVLQPLWSRVNTLIQHPRLHRPTRGLHISSRTRVDNARASKPRNYPEAEWQRIDDEFEARLAKRSWFFRPLFRLLGSPKYHAASMTSQFLLIGTLLSAWIYIWFFLGKAPKPIPRDGTGRPLTDEEIEETETIENYLHSHPVVQALRSQKYLIESRPHWAIPDRDIPHNLTGGTLRGLGRMSVAPIAFSDGEGLEFYAVLHVGRDLCGPTKGVVHTGVLATIADESLARCCFPALPNRIGVTANLNITYDKPLPADSYILVKVYTCKWCLTAGKNGQIGGT